MVCRQMLQRLMIQRMCARDGVTGQFGFELRRFDKWIHALRVWREFERGLFCRADYAADG
jgi:hypothetical protein